MCLNMLDVHGHTVKPDLSSHSKEDQKIGSQGSRRILALCRSKVLRNAQMEHSAVLLSCNKLPPLFVCF